MKFYQTHKNFSFLYKDIRCLSFFLSLALSLVWLAKGQPINIDGITYLHLAQVFQQSGFLVVSKTRGHIWPFYPAMIGLVSSWLHVSGYHIAQLINAVFIALTVVAFVTITRTLNLSFLCQCIAAGVILFYPNLANERAVIFRDFGFYCFMLFGFNAILRFQLTEKYVWFLSWMGLTFIAGLFRIEAWVFLLTIPLSCLIWSSSRKGVLLLKVFGSSALLLAFITLIYICFIQQHIHSSLFTIISTDFIKVFSAMLQSYSHYTTTLRQSLFTVFGYHYAGVLLISGVLGIILVTLIKTMLPLHFFFAAYGWAINSLKLNFSRWIIFLSYFLTYFIILFGFTAQHLFLTDRYVMFLVILLFLPIAPLLGDLYRKHYPQLKSNYVSLLIFLLISLCAGISIVASVLHIGVNKHYYLTGSRWVNKYLPHNATLYMSDPRLTFYVKRNGTKFPEDFPYGYHLSLADMITTFKNNHFSYGMLLVSKHETAAAQQLAAANQLRLIKSFKNNCGDVLMVLENLDK